MLTLRVLVLLVSTVACMGNSDVVVLNSENYREVLDHAPIFLVKYFAPWCGHCQNMAGDYAEAATILKLKDIQIGEVDCIEHEAVCENAMVQGFPTIKFYRNGVFYKEYMGGREQQDFVDFMVAEAALAPDEVGEPEQEGYDEGAGEMEEGEMGEEEYGEEGEGEQWADEDYQEPKGFFTLDRYNYDKVVGVGKYDVFVKFDVMFPAAEIENEFAKLTDRVGNIHGGAGDELVVAAVHIADFDRMENEEIRARYGFEIESLPRYVLWKKDAPNSNIDNGFAFDDEITADGLSRFLMGHLDLYIGLPGCIKEFDRLASGFIELSADERKERIGLAEKAIEELTGEGDMEEEEHSGAVANAKFYLEVMNAIVGSDDPLTNIAEQQQAIHDELQAGGLDIVEPERNSLNTKLNILQMFEESMDHVDF